MSKTRRCGTCQWWEETGQGIDIVEHRSGLCHRYPATYAKMSDNGFPRTAWLDWCGEHTPLPPEMTP